MFAAEPGGGLQSSEKFTFSTPLEQIMVLSSFPDFLSAQKYTFTRSADCCTTGGGAESHLIMFEKEGVEGLRITRIP